MKLLMWLLLGLLVYWALRSQAKHNRAKFERDNLRHAAHTNHSNSDRSNPAPPKSSAPAENMVACAYCQIYLPASEAIHHSSEGYYFCSYEHAKLHSSTTNNSPKQPLE